MSKGALSKRHMEGIGEGSLTGTLSRLLQLTSEAVLIFGADGRVLLANDEASELFVHAENGLMNLDVRLLFPAPDGSEPTGRFSLGDLPFPTDGTMAFVAGLGSRGRLVSMRVRCDRVQAPDETYLLVARAANQDEVADRDYDRTVADLRRANHRLSGALNIVLDTLDSEDVATLFRRVLEEMAETVEADGTIVYLAKADGFHLRGVSDGLRSDRIPRFMPFGQGVGTLATRVGHAIRLRIAAPSGAALRQGRLTVREVVNEETREILRVKSDILPPFTSFMAVPVWFGGRVIAIFEVGWRRMHPLLREDAQLLDSVAHYLSVQLAGAFASLRAQRADRLDKLDTELREELMAPLAKGESMADRIRDVLREAAGELEATLVEVQVNSYQRVVMADLPLNGQRELPLDVDAFIAGHQREGVAVVGFSNDAEITAFLRGHGEPCMGALVDVGEVQGLRRCYLVLRPDGAEPLDEVEFNFLMCLAEDAREIATGEEAREQDKHISQALQRGMRNELQKVPGITAQAVYSSATAAAFVGGDFYDLIRLPDRKACVIMGDVSGKGVEAASVSAAVKTALGAYAWEGLTPARMVRSLNDFLLSFSRLETFATLFVGIVDLAAATITYCSAGHPPAILVEDGAQEIFILDVQSGVVGAFPDIAYQDGVVEISEGDVLLLYTDGTTEARDPSGAFFGEQGLRDMVMRESADDKPYDGFVDRLLATLDDFTGQHLDDDVAMVALRFDELGEPED